VVAGVCTAIALGYFAVTDRPETVPDLSREETGGPVDEAGSDRTPISLSGGNSKNDASTNVQNRIEGRTLSDADLKPAIDSSPKLVAESLASESFSEPFNRESSAGKLSVTSPDQSTALAYSSDPYGLLPTWLTECDPVSRSTPKPALESENQGTQISENARRGNEAKPEGSIASFVAIQGNELLQSAPPLERREPQGYFTIESKPESLRSTTGRNHSPKPLEDRAKTGDDPLEPQENPPKSPDDLSKHGDYPAKPGDLKRFALDFVRTDQVGSVADQHRFYADSVHFYDEGDLSWAGIAAATRRYHKVKQNRRYEAAAPAVVQGPVDGGFYVVDQPISWSQTDGSRLTHGRSMLHLRVVPTGRGGWKITSIEETGQ
jgi:hypothetical protein